MCERRVTISKLDHLGKRLISYPGEIILDDGDMLAARCLWTLPKTVDLGPFTIAPGDILVEYYFARQPFNIFAIYTAQKDLKGWYCNVLEHTLIARDTIDWADLALDLVVTPDGKQTVLDEDEFEALDPSPAQRAQAVLALNTLNEWVQRRRTPFSDIAATARAGTP